MSEQGLPPGPWEWEKYGFAVLLDADQKVIISIGACDPTPEVAALLAAAWQIPKLRRKLAETERQRGKLRDACEATISWLVGVRNGTFQESGLDQGLYMYRLLREVEAALASVKGDECTGQ